MARFVAFAALACIVAQAAWAGPTRHIDLRSDGALEALQQANPVHYAKVEEILERTRRFPEAGPSRWVPASVNASEVLYSEHLLKTSYPPKQALHFRLDDMRYTLDVTRHDVAARVTPAPR